MRNAKTTAAIRRKQMVYWQSGIVFHRIPIHYEKCTSLNDTHAACLHIPPHSCGLLRSHTIPASTPSMSMTSFAGIRSSSPMSV